MSEQFRTSKYPEKFKQHPISELEKIDAPSALFPANVPQSENVKGVNWGNHFLTECKSAWDGLNEQRVTRDPEHTAEGHVLRVSESAQKQRQRIEKEFDRAREQFGLARTAYKQAIADQAKLTEDRYGSEIRSVLRSMKDTDRQTAIIQAIQEGDAQTVSAAVSGPAISVGLTREQQKNFRRMFEKKQAPEAFEALEQINRAEEKSLAAFEMFTASTGKLGEEQRAHEIRKRQEAARKAAAPLSAA